MENKEKWDVKFRKRGIRIRRKEEGVPILFKIRLNWTKNVGYLIR